MSDSDHHPAASLSREEIAAAVATRLEKYDALGFLERFAMFMGVAQILELSLKGLLHRRFSIDPPEMERWTLGRTAKALSEFGLRADFLKLLQSVVEDRNYIAHELLANEAILRSLLSGESGRFEMRHLERAIYEVEQLMFLYEWTSEHQAW